MQHTHSDYASAKTGNLSYIMNAKTFVLKLGGRVENTLPRLVAGLLILSVPKNLYVKSILCNAVF